MYENATTGYMWIINEDDENDIPVLELVYDEYMQNFENDEDMVGVGSTRVLRYKAINEGMHTIEMAYA